MFRGRYAHSLDAKGRLGFASGISKGVWSRQRRRNSWSRGTSPNLAWWPIRSPVWTAFEARVAELSDFDETIEALQQLYVAEAHECAIDKLGRVLLPPASPRIRRPSPKTCTVVGQVKKADPVVPRPSGSRSRPAQKTKLGQDQLAQAGGARACERHSRIRASRGSGATALAADGPVVTYRRLHVRARRPHRGHRRAVCAPDGRVLAVDRDPNALALAARSAVERFSDRVTLVEGSILRRG